MITGHWNAIEFTLPFHIPTMLTNEEVQYLYWLGKTAWDGTGNIIEIGPWLGGSTACLAAGMRDSGHDGAKRLKVFDNFIWRRFMAERAELPLKPGESFQTFFLENMSGYSDIVDAFARALPDEEIPNDTEAQDKRFHEEENVPVFENLFNQPIFILFIDGAKSWHGMLHLLKTLNADFIPGHTLLVCQDYKYWGTYWVPVMLARLAAYLEPVHNISDGTTVTFRLTAPLPSEQLDAFEPAVTSLDTNLTLNHIDDASAILAKTNDAQGAANVSLAKVSFLAHQGHTQQAVHVFKGIQKHWPASFPNWQLERVRTYLAQEKHIVIPPPLSHRLRGFLRKVKKKITG